MLIFFLLLIFSIPNVQNLYFFSYVCTQKVNVEWIMVDRLQFLLLFFVLPHDTKAIGVWFKGSPSHSDLPQLRKCIYLMPFAFVLHINKLIINAIHTTYVRAEANGMKLEFIQHILSPSVCMIDKCVNPFNETNSISLSFQVDQIHWSQAVRII